MERMVLALVVAVILTPPMVGGVAAKAGLLSVGGAALAVALAWRGAFIGPRNAATTGAVLLLVAALVSVAVAPAPVLAVSAAAGVYALLAAHLAGRACGGRPGAWRSATVVLLAACAVVAVDGLLRSVELRAALDAGLATESARAAALSTRFFRHSYFPAHLMAAALSLAVGVALAPGPRRWRTRIAVAVLGGPCLGYLLVVLSRAAWIALVVGAATVLLASTARRRMAVAGALGGGLVLAAATTGLGDDSSRLRDRFQELVRPAPDSGAHARLDVWAAAGRTAMGALPAGVGAGHFAVEVQEEFHGAGYVSHAHQQFLHVLTETGPLGLLGLTLLLGGAIAGVWRRRPDEGRAPDDGEPTERRGRRAALLGALAASTTSFLFETPLLVAPTALVFGLVTGACVASPSGAQARGPRRSRPLLVGTASALLAIGVVVGREAAGGVLCAKAVAARDAGDASEAVRLAARAERLAPYVPWFLTVRASTEVAAGDIDAALATHARHEAIAPGVPGMIAAYADVARAARRPALEERCLLQLLRHRPERVDELSLRLAEALLAAGRFVEAERVLATLVVRGFDRREPRVAEVRARLSASSIDAAARLREERRRAP